VTNYVNVVISHRQIFSRENVIKYTNYKHDGRAVLFAVAELPVSIIIIISHLTWLMQIAQPYKHTVYNVQQQSATQGSNDTANTVTQHSSNNRI